MKTGLVFNELYLWHDTGHSLLGACPDNGAGSKRSEF
jgi:hypothetical protein